MKREFFFSFGGWLVGWIGHGDGKRGRYSDCAFIRSKLFYFLFLNPLESGAVSSKKSFLGPLFYSLVSLNTSSSDTFFVQSFFLGGGGSTRLCVPLAKEIVIGNHNASKYFLGVPMI